MSEALKREDLYALVWSEPTVKVAARFGVSSSYLARICTLLNVPRPERGHWAKSAYGKTPPTPALPDPRPGDELVWVRGETPASVARPLPKPPNVFKKPVRSAATAGEHPLVKGAQSLFETGRVSRLFGYLKPQKYLLVDLAVSKSALERALAFANQLFLELEAFGHRVVIAPASESFRRAPVDPRGERQKRHSEGDSELWSPGRCTVTYVGTVAIGMTIIEIAEQAEARYVDGAFVRVRDYVPPKRHRFVPGDSWTTQHPFPTGRLCVQAFSPYPGTEWTRQWSETKERDLADRIPAIVRGLQAAAPEIARLAEEAARVDEERREQWKEQSARLHREEMARRAAEARRASKDDLLKAIEHWTEAQGIARFFNEVEECIRSVDPALQKELEDRIARARELIGNTDAFDYFRKWKAPNERQ